MLLGNLTRDNVDATYHYNINNLLTRVSRPGLSTSLHYDSQNRLARLTAGSSQTGFMYDGQDLILEMDKHNQVTARYVHGPGVDDPIVWYDGSGTTKRYLAENHQGSVISVSDESGNNVMANAYDEYGIPSISNFGRFQYTGQMWLGDEIQLYYYKARVYNPVLGRFLQTDPIGYEDQMNLYAYVGNDPLNMVDPTGESGTCSMQPACRSAKIKVVKQAAQVVKDSTEPGTAIHKAAAAVEVVAGSVGKVRGKKGVPKKAVPNSPTGKGSVPPNQRDPKRVWTKKEKSGALDQRNGKCDGCGNDISVDNARGHHIKRHADGGRTTDDNLAILCDPCHKDIHKK